MVIYSAGLRISEAINLPITDIDSKRNQIRISQSKGRKERYTMLAAKTLQVLRTYVKEYQPKTRLFEDQNGEPYSARSIQAFFKDALKRAGITKNPTVHTLRHSFATHHLENCTDLCYILQLLGHATTKTTESYTSLTKRGEEKLNSPLNFLENI